MAQPAAAAPAPPVEVVMNGLSDLLPESYSGDDSLIDTEEFFGRFRQWLGIHNYRFATNADKVAAIRYVLSGTALQWFNSIPATNMPANLDLLQIDFYANFRVAKTRLEWKKDLGNFKNIPGTNSLTMINKFQLCCNKLQWPLPVQIEKFVRRLPIQLSQFVVSRAHATFSDIADSIRTFQELLEVDVVTHVFMNVSFSDEKCILCNDNHRSLNGPSLRSMIEMEVSSTSITPDSQLEPRSGSLNRVFRPQDHMGPNRSPSQYKSPNEYDRDFHSGNPYMPSDDYDYCPYEGYRNTGNRHASPKNYDRGYSRSYGFSRVKNNSGFRNQAPNARQFQPHNRSQSFINRNRYRNENTYSSQGLHVDIPTKTNDHHSHTIQINKGYPIIEIQWPQS